MTENLKILVCGDVRGNFRLLFDRVEKLNKKKGPFDFLCCVGEFFGSSPSNWEPYKTGALKAPLLTYILGPNDENCMSYYEDESGSEMCHNVYHLGKRGILSSSGLKIAYVSGVENSRSKNIKISDKDVQAVRDIAYRGKEASQYLGIDVLLTSDWPKNVTNLVGNVEDNIKKAAEEGSELLAWLASQIKPRYHFAAHKDIYYERPPYRNHLTPGKANAHCTRFISLSDVTGKKWMYGAVLTPLEKMNKDKLYEKTINETDSPFERTISYPQDPQYFYDLDSKQEGRSSKKRKRDFSQEKCWFCLAGGQDLHTVINIGTEAYVALPKGGLHPRHLMICPIKHLESYLHLPNSARNEFASIKKAITKYYWLSKEIPVFFERYFITSHLQLNAVPVPKSCVNKLREAFIKEAAKHKLHLIEIPKKEDLGNILRLEEPYLHVELPEDFRFYIRCERNFPIHFARIVLVGKDILDVKDKVDWKKCVLPEEEEQELAKRLRKEFGELYSNA